MKREIKNILEEAKLAPSVLNSQPWRFRVCGNTIEVYFERQPELAEIDPYGRLQLASCGSLIAFVTHAVEKNGWTAKVDYFPRFEEENLVAYIEIKESREKVKPNGPESPNQHSDEVTRASKSEILSEITAIASDRNVNLFVHNDGPDRQLQTYFEEKCGRRLEEAAFQEHLTMLFRTGSSDPDASYDDEVLLSDHFFKQEASSVDSDHATEPDLVADDSPFLILVTGTDNRYAWTRSGEVLAKALLRFKRIEGFGLMALPIISKNPCCRDWLKNELNIKGYPQFVLKMGDIRQREHFHKRSLQELIKYGF